MLDQLSLASQQTVNVRCRPQIFTGNVNEKARRDFRTLARALLLGGGILFAGPSFGERLESRGIAALWSGVPNSPGQSFQGTAFHIGDAWFVTAAHVIDGIPPAFDKKFHIVLAARESASNAIPVVSQTYCDEVLDMCFFRAEPANSLMRDQGFAEAFVPLCHIPNETSMRLATYGFSGESSGLKAVDDGYNIQSRLSNFTGPSGREYNNVIVTGAPTSPGLSGSPVTVVGSNPRQVVGVHTGYSSDTNNQVIVPFYSLDSAVQVGGDIVLDCTRVDGETLNIDQESDPAVELLREVLRVCSVSRNIEIDAELRGSIATVFSGSLTDGRLKYVDTSTFLDGIPEQQRLDAYRVYTNCILSSMSREN